MSKSSRRRQPVRGDRRTHAEKNPLGDLPILPVVVGGILLLLGAIALVYANLGSSTAASAGGSKKGIQCQASEQQAVHYHSHLTLIVAGTTSSLPANIGIDDAHSCLYWLHTHATDGIIHIEAPKSVAKRKFTLGDFFDIWGKPLDEHHLGATTVGGDQKLTMFVDGAPYVGDPRKIVLAAHTVVTIEVTPPEIPAPDFKFPPGV
ncbi:MAG: hypothetical protein M3Z13_00970 [Candidatus Dormibacteraeota bacterium]|nr:hypothetical protein [Candidatus Dormibacteraeota bacterium]